MQAPTIAYDRTPEPKIHYWAAYGFPFASPNRWKNLLMGGVCMIIPVVGPMVWMGYLAELLDAKVGAAGAARPPGGPVAGAPYAAAETAAPPQVLAYGDYATWLPYADFDFNRFVEYLTRGLWPFLAQFVIGLVFMPVMFLAMVPMIFGPALGLDTGGFIALACVSILLYLAAMALQMVAAVPVWLRAALMQEFAPAFSWTFIKDFVGRVWPQLLGVGLFVMATAVPLMILGYAMCFVGLYPAVALLYFAIWHLEYQLYLLYLHRGGTPIPIKPPPPPPPHPAWPYGQAAQPQQWPPTQPPPAAT